MIFTLMKDKEITKKAKELGGYYTAEFAMGYMMTHHPVLLMLDFLMASLLILCVGFIFYR